MDIDRWQHAVSRINHILEHLAHAALDIRIVDRCDSHRRMTELCRIEHALTSYAMRLISLRGGLEDEINAASGPKE